MTPDEVITRGPVTLRRWREDDLDAVFQAVTESLDHLRPWMPWAADYTRQSAAEFLGKSVRSWADGTEYGYAILAGGALAGSCGLMARIGPGGLEIGYWVHRAWTRRGLATTASAVLVEQAFRLPGVDRVEIWHDELNVASGGVPRKLGFTEVGRRPLSEPSPGGTGVGVVWRLTRPVALAGMGYGQADQNDRDMMALALGQARASLDAGGVPVGAVLAEGTHLIGAGHNERVQQGDPVAHGEISCLRNVGRRPNYAGTTLYTTLSPCQMCSGAILLFQIPRVVVGEAETYEGDLGFLAGRGVEIVLLDDPDCKAAMREFQQRYPQVWSEDIGGR
jgi:tRNA(Arg) A34 adenosine deaminase TadA/RimJ/RimL family protein N-acetyltransferase